MNLPWKKKKLTREEQIEKFLEQSMEDIRTVNPQYIFEMWMYERRKNAKAVEFHESLVSAVKEFISQSYGGASGTLPTCLTEAEQLVERIEST